MVSEREFKQTEIGRVPREWEVVSLSKVFVIASGKSRPLETSEIQTEKMPYPIYGGNGILGYTNKFMISNETIVIGRVGEYCGSIHKAPKLSWITDNALYAIEIQSHNINLDFLTYWLTFINLNKFKRESGQPLMTQTIIYSIKLPLPPLPEQKKIAEILSTVDKAIEKVNEAIEKTQRLKKGLMQELLTKGIGHREFKDTEIGRIPKEWEAVRLAEILRLCQYGLSMKMSEEGKYPILKMDDIINGYVTSDNVKRVDLDEQTFKNFKLERGDILFNRTNSYELVGRTGIFLLSGDYVFASYLIRLKPKREIIDSHFLTFYLIFRNDNIRKLASRAVHQANINATNLQKFKLPLLPLPEQKKIAEILSTVDKRLELLRRKKEKLERVKKGLMDDLLSGRKRVKVN